MNRWGNTDTSWGMPARLLHWTIAALVAVQVALGWSAVTWRLSPLKLDLFVWHKSFGMVVLLLVIVRMAWRWANGAPRLPDAMTPLQRAAAKTSHGLLYAVLILMPLTGWITNSASNVPFRMFWRIPIMAIVPPDKAVASAAAYAHWLLFILLAVLLSIHVGAALWHHFVQRDDVLRRMLSTQDRGR